VAARTCGFGLPALKADEERSSGSRPPRLYGMAHLPGALAGWFFEDVCDYLAIADLLHVGYGATRSGKIYIFPAQSRNLPSAQAAQHREEGREWRARGADHGNECAAIF
jgi:hypothetical protein